MAKQYLPFDAPFPLSRAVVSNEKYTMEVSGQIGTNAETGKLEDGVEKQTERAMELIIGILGEVGWTLDNVTKTRIFLTDMENYDKMNKVYERYFPKNYPARFALAVKGLPAGALVEIDCTATGDSIKSNQSLKPASL